jgi:hypothetical protein
VEEEEDEEAQAEKEEDEGEVQVDAQEISVSRVSTTRLILASAALLTQVAVSEAMSLAAARPLIGVHSDKNAPTGTTVCLPAVFRAPVRCSGLDSNLLVLMNNHIWSVFLTLLMQQVN